MAGALEDHLLVAGVVAKGNTRALSEDDGTTGAWSVCGVCWVLGYVVCGVCGV